MTSPQPALVPGSFFLRHIPGWQGRGIAAVQAFVRGGSFWTHAGLVLDNGQAIQGQPGGAVIFPAELLLNGRPLLVSDRPAQGYLAGLNVRVGSGIEGATRARVVAEARKLVGAKYSYLDYPVLGLAEWSHTHPKDSAAHKVSDRLRQRVNASGHLICSALVDRAYLNAGVHLFDDGRLPGDVTPQDLAEYAAGAA